VDPFHAEARRRLCEIYLPTLPRDILFSVVLPTYNRCRALVRCLDSLRRNSFFRLDIRVICEPCADGSLEYLATQQGSMDVNVTINPTRLGMSPSINLGLSQSKGDYIFLINDDLEFMPGWDVSVVKTLAAFPEAGCGVPLVLYPNGAIQSPGNYNPFRSHTHEWIGRVPHVDTAPAFGKPIGCFPQLHIPRPCDYGYFPVFKRACWEKVGYVDDGFKRYFIDPDFGYRVQQAGYQNIYCPHSVLIHHELSHKDMTAVYEVARGDRQHFFDKWNLYMYPAAVPKTHGEMR
jgi:GT2 family glycosyltransferase